MKYVWAFDLSMACVGVTIFLDDGSLIDIFSIETNPDDTHQMKLHSIGKILLKYKKKYKPNTIVIEQGFTRFNRSTQVIFRVHGLINYLFKEAEQIYYPSLTIRKEVVGAGNVKKDEVRKFIENLYPQVTFSNFDESDSFAVGLCYFYKEGILKRK